MASGRMQNTTIMNQMIAEQIDEMLDGSDEKATPQRMNAFSKACSVLLTGCTKRLQYAKMRGTKVRIAFLDK